MKIKNIIISSALLLFIGIGLFIGKTFYSKQRYVRMFVTFGRTELPCVDIHIQGKTYSVLVNLSSCVPLTLSKDVLSSIHKETCEPTLFQDSEGNKIESSTFLVSEVKMGDLTFKDVRIAEGGEKLKMGQRVGEIGLPLLKQNNLVLDFPHSTIIACNHRKKLKEIGYSVEEMIPVPFEIVERAGGILLPVLTDLGAVKLALSTGMTLNLIRSSLLQENGAQRPMTIEMDGKNWDQLQSAAFIIGGENWGSQNLYLQDFPSDLREFNGVIGMDFLSKHILYLDFENQKVYIDRD